MFITVIATTDRNLAKAIDDIMFAISQKDNSFVYKTKKYMDKVSFAIYSANRDIAYKRGLLMKKYVKEKTGVNVYFKVVEGGD